jgi:hypothetical protein
MMCGKAIISPTKYESVRTQIRFKETPPSARSSDQPSSMRLSGQPRETFIVEVLYNEEGDKIYKCPICKSVTGTWAPKNPYNTSLFAHNPNCPNTNKIPIEE